MKIKHRETVFIVGGILVVALAWLARAKPWAAATAGGGVVGEQLARVEQYGQLRREVVQKAEQLGVKIPTVGLPDQESAMRRELNKMAQSNGLELGSLARLDSGGARSSAAQSVVDFQFDVKGRYDGLVKFINALERGKTPFYVMELRVTAGGGSGGGGGSAGRSGRSGGGGGEKVHDGKIQATLKARGYLFPRVFESKSSKDEDKPAPSASPRPSAEATPTPATVAAAPGAEATPTPTPAAGTPTPTPAAATGRPHKITMRFQGHEIVIDLDNRTQTMDGQTKTMDDEEYQKAMQQISDDSWRKELPPDAEVTVE
jgi:hypothetical protein